MASIIVTHNDSGKTHLRVRVMDGNRSVAKDSFLASGQRKAFEIDQSHRLDVEFIKAVHPDKRKD